jgi:predicted amidohydrolase YtcJ
MSNDLILRNARIWTGDGSYADTALIQEGRFAFVGRANELNAPGDTSVLDMRGQFVMPGFTDAHAHLLGTGMAMRSVDLKGVTSAEEAARRVAERAASQTAGTWITGAGWDQNVWPHPAFPTTALLDSAAPEHPVLLDHTSGHCVWVNTRALHLGGIKRDTAAPDGGAIDLGPDGEPTGILRDHAARLVTSVMPRPSQNDRIDALHESIAHANRLGVTSVHAMNVGRGEFQALHALNDSGHLELRVHMFLAHERLDEWIERNAVTGDGDNMLRVGGVKFFADGALGSLTAWMFEPYATADTCGFPLQPIEDLERDVRRSLGHGLAPAIHAIGDRANHEVLNILERAANLGPGLPRCIEHAQVLRESDVPRFRGLGVTASMQPIHATADWRKVDREWGDRGRLAYAFSALGAAGANIAFGSDSPVETMDPFAGVQAAVTRQTSDHLPPGGWQPQERITVAHALRHYTVGSVLAPGFPADFVALASDPFTLDSIDLGSLEVTMTGVGGKVVFRG